jgi:acetylornithine/N-succinyldiaminopimelate aminotransferase
VGSITNRALEKGLLIISASNDVLRFVPPLVISEADVDEAVRILEACI